MSVNQQIVNIFYFYHENDKSWKDKLQKQIGNNSILHFDNTNIPPGSDRRNTTDLILSSVDVILLLLSAEFIDSYDDLTHDIHRISERRSKEEICIIPIILRTCNWKEQKFYGTCLEDYQVLPRNGISISEKSSYKKTTELHNIAEEIRKKVRNIQERKANQRDAVSREDPPISFSPLENTQHSIITPDGESKSATTEKRSPNAFLKLLRQSSVLLIEKTIKPIAALSPVLVCLTLFNLKVWNYALLLQFRYLHFPLFLRVFILFLGIYGLWIIIIYYVEIKWIWREHRNFKIVAMGFPNAGKTVLLSCMFQRLKSPIHEDFFTLDIIDRDPQIQRNRLANAYDSIENKGIFPLSTSGTKVEWRFIATFRRSKTQSHTFFKYTYLDYPGEEASAVFSEQRTPSNARYENIFHHADILWIILDGQEILKFMKGNPGSDFYINLNRLLEKVYERQKPTLFLLTKWDLLNYNKFTLTDIIKQLKQSFDLFSQIVNQYRRFGTLRMIPVSSVGNNYFRERTDGGMEKIGEPPMHPYNMEIPLIYSIFELFGIQPKKYPVTQDKQKIQNNAKIERRLITTKEARKSMYSRFCVQAEAFDTKFPGSDLTH